MAAATTQDAGAAGENLPADTTVEAKVATESLGYVDLPSGSALDASETLVVTRALPTQLIVFAGGEASGKTTLLASIYESLQEGPFADLFFAGSRSLVGFEEICHRNRLTSGQHAPDTERTKPSEQAEFYHLSLVDGALSSAAPLRREVLIAAVSGERFRLARDSSDDCSALTFLRRADVVAVLIDGAKLAQLDSREGALADAEGVLRSFVDAGMLNRRARAEFVFSKHDCIQKAGSATETFLERARTRLVQSFTNRITNLGTRCIAARPLESELPFAFGVAEALRTWLSDSTSPAEAVQWSADFPESEREFARYGWRYRLIEE